MRPGGARSAQGPALFLGNEALPPIIFMQDGRPAGVIVDLARALAQRMHRRVEIRLMNWTQAQQLVQEGRADALLQINPSPERQEVLDFSAAAARTRRNARPRRMLIVEDAAEARNSLREVLECEGHAVESARDGAEGLDKALSFKPEVVLCALGLPVMDGYGLARALRACPGSSRVLEEDAAKAEPMG